MTTKAERKKTSNGSAVGARVNNGAPDRGLTEAVQLVRGSKLLIEGMRKRAVAEGVGIVALWRKAAERYLND